MKFSEYLNAFDFFNGDLAELDKMLNNEFVSGDPKSHRRALIDILDRLGNGHHLNGIDWSILHGLESLDGHNEAVIQDWKPTYWRKTMVRRIINSGVKKVSGIYLENLLKGCSA